MAFRFPHCDEPTRISVLLLIAAGYFVAGQLGLLLAIPPGYATAIWPPAGIALGCLLLWGNRYWAGVLLGSLLTNLVASYTNTNPEVASQETLLRSLMLAASIAGGAALQATVGAKLIRHFVDNPMGLTHERDVLAFFAIGGPLVHVINATWGTTTLLVAEMIPASAFIQHWWTWWVGDTIGALIFAPLMVMWLSQDTAWASRRTVVTVPLCAALFTAIALFMYTSHTDWQNLKQRLAEDSNDLSAAIANEMDLNIETMHAIGALLATGHALHRDIDGETFARFAAPLLARHTELHTLAWAPRTSTQTEAQFQVRFAAPNDSTLNDNTLMGLGLDKQLHRTLSSATAYPRVTATALQAINTANPTTLMLTLPVFSLPADVSQVDHLQGYVLGTLQVPTLLANALHGQELASMIDVAIDDVSDAASISVLRPQTHAHPTALDFTHTVQFDIANRHWQATFTPTLAYLAARQPSSAWLVLAGGLLFTALIGAGALLITGRAQSIETLVAQRTTELAQINEKLADEICDHLSTEHTLEKERELLRTVVNNLYEGIMVLDTAGELKMANGVAYRMLRDITGEELVELPQHRTYRIYAPDGLTELMPEQTPHYCALRGQTVSDFEMVVQAPGRAAMTLIVNAQPLLTNDNERHGAIIVMRDITDSKAIERMKAEFVATVSHELRTPITSIRGSLGLIAGGVTGPLADKTRNLVEIALRNSDRLARLINDLLDMEKMETGKMQFELLPHPLTTLIEQAIEANSGYAQSFNIRFALQTTSADIMVTVDSFRLLQVMSNLLSNAAKFSAPQSTVEITAVDRIAMDGSRIALVQVTDHGPGIPEEFRARIFQKFSQADSSDTRAKSGTGLGLAICKAIIEQMGGKIGYETRAGIGSTFYFELPQSSAATHLQAAV